MRKPKEMMRRNTKVKQKDNNNASVPLISNSTTQDCVTVERCCENVDCNASKLLAMVPTRKTSQFVLQPSIMEKPTLINGFTTVFQVEGTAVRLRDIKNAAVVTAATTTTTTTTMTTSSAAIVVTTSSSPSAITTTTEVLSSLSSSSVSSSSSSSSSLSSLSSSSLMLPSFPSHIYRIVPNTHAHVVNYVVVDGEDELLRKIQDSDPATMRKLLDSQKVSAEQMLKTLMVGINVNVGNGNSGGSGGVASRSPGDDNSTASNSNATTTTTIPTANVDNIDDVTTVNDGPTLGEVTLPTRKHPDLQITSITSAKASLSNVTEMPLITTSLTANLQNIIITTAAADTVTTVTTTTTTTTTTTVTSNITVINTPSSANVTNTKSSTATTDPIISVISIAKAVEENSAFDKMQAELQELRRTVALLAEAQAKTSQATQRRKMLANNNNPGSSKVTTIAATRSKRTRKMMED